MDELMNYQCIDFRKLLILKGKQLNINDEECHVLMIILTLSEIGMKGINPYMISQYSSYNTNKIDSIMISLVDKKLLGRDKGILKLDPLYHLLLTNKNKKVEEKNLIVLFENAFGRSFSQLELNVINGYKIAGYDDEMIIDALNEAVKAGVYNFRYIEKILINWTKYGKKQRFAPKKDIDDGISEEVKNYNWWNNEERKA